MKNDKLSFDGKSFIINGNRTFLNNGELHYFRIPESQWKDRLLKCKKAFLNCIGAYIAWNWHEEKEGEFNFKGNRNLDKWLSLMEELNFLIFIRPGPYICSEWDFGGFPNWLIPKDCELRSLEPNYIRYCTRYLNKVDKIIKPHLITKGGKVFLYQVENEFLVGDIPYHLKLKEIAEKDGIDVPICTNENPWVRGTDIIEGLDPYLRSWIISDVTNKVKNLLKTQPDKPPLALEMGTEMYARFYGQLPFSGGYSQPELEEVNLKALIAAGLSGYNWYMYHGGTNPGYWTTRDTATTYDFEAPIREWGELGSRYWISRRIGGFLESFQEQLLETVPTEGECSVDTQGVEIFVRKDKEKAFLFLANPYAASRLFKITLKDQNFTIPQKGKFHLPGYSMVILPVNLKLSNYWTVLYTTSEIFYLLDNGKEKTLIFYREDGLDGEIALKTKGKATKLLNYTHKKEPQYLKLEGKEELNLIILDKETASKTWLFTHKGKKYPAISNLYFLEDEKEEKNGITLTFQTKEGDNWLKVPLQPKEVKVNDKEATFTYDKKKGVASISFPKAPFPKIHYELFGQWKTREETIENLLEDNSIPWLDWQPWEGLEKYGFLKNGYAYYKNTFILSEDKSPLYLTLTSFQDEASIYLNGKYVTSGRDNIRCEVSSFVKTGDNLLLILLESEGHNCQGEKSFNGINCPVFLSSEEESIDLVQWKRKLLPEPYSHKSLTSAKEPEIRPEFDDSSWETVRVDKKWDSRLLKNTWLEECFLWYRTEVDIPSRLTEKALSLEFEAGMRDEIYIFVNGNFSGLRINPVSSAFAFDISDKVKEGKNIFVIGIKSDRCIANVGLYGKVRISAYDNYMSKDWKIKEGLSGQNKGYFRPDFDDSDWEESEANKKEFTAGSLLWFRKKVEIEVPPDYVCPLRLTLKDTAEKALIYFNGVLIGRYSEKGCQEHFYIYEDLLKEKNTVAILVDGRGSKAKLGQVSISSYYITKRSRLNLCF